jgi:antirestriction protein ArdC
VPIRASKIFKLLVEEEIVRDIYKEVTEQILDELRNGVRPWLCPWSKTPGLNVPANAITGRAYSGISTLLLWTARRHGWLRPRFLTFKQALEVGGYVRKGEHGQRVVFVKSLRFRESEEDNERIVRMLRNYVVFNIAQCDELPNKLIVLLDGPFNPDQRDAQIDEFIAATGARFEERDIEDRAFYNWTSDVICVPAFKAFKSKALYAAATFHELIHWTGHVSRLDRHLEVRFGADADAAEELIAELGAAFLCAEFSIDGYVAHAAYIEHFLKLLGNDPKAIFTAASKAQAAVDFLRQKILTEPVPIEDDRSAA